MARAMPKDMQELMDKLHDPDTIREIQTKWNAYVTANEQYERNYPQQFGNLVEGNLKFKEQKSIPTPAEQMAMFEDMVREEIEDHLEQKDTQDKEQVYELDHKQPDDTPIPELPNDRVEKLADFRLSFEDTDLRDKRVPKTNDIDKSQELNVVWLQDYKDQKAREEQQRVQKKNKTQQEQDKPYELNLTFGRLDEHNKSSDHIKPEEPGLEPGEG